MGRGRQGTVRIGRSNLIGWLLSASAMCATPALAAVSVAIDVNPNTSTPGGIVPDVNGAEVVYNYTIYNGQGVSDTIPLQVCMTGSANTDWTSVDVTFGTVNGNLNGVDLPGTQTFVSNASVPDCRNLTVQIDTGIFTLANPNVGQNFVGNVNLSEANPSPSTGPDKPNVTFADIKTLKIKIEVLPSAQSNVSCYLTDSEGIFLRDCNGALVSDSGSDDGRFTIVTNKKLTEVATNPGQFYFNFVWANTTGVSQTVTVDFNRIGVVAHGRQAIHAAVFNGYLSTITAPSFDEANANGIPDGDDDQAANITVPAGSSLLVTYHLTWEGLGSPVPAGCGGSCGEANQLLQVTGTVTGAGIATESCTAKAYGFRK